MEKLMDSVSHIMTNTEYRSKCIRTRTQMSDSVNGILTQSQGKGQNVEIQATEIEIFGTADPATYPYTSSRGNRFQELITQFIYIHNDLNIINCRTVIQGGYLNEREVNALRMGAFE